jgi:hypothetical protein
MLWDMKTRQCCQSQKWCKVLADVTVSKPSTAYQHAASLWKRAGQRCAFVIQNIWSQYETKLIVQCTVSVRRHSARRINQHASLLEKRCDVPLSSATVTGRHSRRLVFQQSEQHRLPLPVPPCVDCRAMGSIVFQFSGPETLFGRTPCTGDQPVAYWHCRT